MGLTLAPPPEVLAPKGPTQQLFKAKLWLQKMQRVGGGLDLLQRGRHQFIEWVERLIVTSFLVDGKLCFCISVFDLSPSHSHYHSDSI